MGKASGKTHTKEQLDHWANLHNPNNKARFTSFLLRPLGVQNCYNHT